MLFAFEGALKLYLWARGRSFVIIIHVCAVFDKFALHLLHFAESDPSGLYCSCEVFLRIAGNIHPSKNSAFYNLKTSPF